jgi:hypothetical protein
MRGELGLGSRFVSAYHVIPCLSMSVHGILLNPIPLMDPFYALVSPFFYQHFGSSVTEIVAHIDAIYFDISPPADKPGDRRDTM